MEDKPRYNRIILRIIGVVVLIIGLIGITYAFFNYTKTGNLNNLGTGIIRFNSQQGNTISLTNVFPMTKAEAQEDTLNATEIAINGKTTYSEGEEFAVSIVDVENTVGNRTIPVNYLATYTANTNKTIGTNSNNYWKLRNNKNANIYSLNSIGTIAEGEQILVGYIKSDNDGIDGTLTIKAYIDASKVAITDTYPPSSYVLNTSKASECVSYHNTVVGSQYLLEGETFEAFCDGTGTFSGKKFQEVLDEELFSDEQIEYFIEHEIILSRGYSNITTSEWVNGRMVLTTSEWNTLKTNPISFKIRVESNEGVWVNEPSSRNDMVYLNSVHISSEQLSAITEINFIKMNLDMINEHNNLIDLTADGGQGVVKGWIEGTRLYVASPGETYFPSNINSMFSDLSNLTNINFNNVNMSSVTTMMALFNGCTGLTTLDLRGLHTSSVTKMEALFMGCTGLTSIDLSDFDTHSVQDMDAMFMGCSSLVNLDLSHFNTSNVTSMNSMFWQCTSLESINLAGFDTEDVTDMSGMFAECTSLTSLNISSFKTNSLAMIPGMFADDTSLVTIEVGSNWNVSSVGVSNDMFVNCTSIRGSQNTTYDANFVDNTYAKVDGGPTNKGYLTLKTN